jgi:hypothetical protein
MFATCGTMGKPATNETPTRGNIHIVADESFQPLIETEVFTFTHLYKGAHIKPLFKPEYDVINDFMNDSVKVIVTSKKLSDSQIQYLRDTLIIARTSTFAYDALAIIKNIMQLKIFSSGKLRNGAISTKNRNLAISKSFLTIINRVTSDISRNFLILKTLLAEISML